MRGPFRTVWAAALSVGLGALATSILAAPQQSAVPPDPAARSAAPITSLNGVWDYNDKDSVNAATGRPEQGTPGQRRPIALPPGRSGPVMPPPSGGVGGGGVGGGGRGGGGFGGSSSPEAANLSRLAADEARTLMRDLLEVPERLTINATPADVRVVDDLERELVFPLDGKPRKYRLSASTFDARATWAEGQLTKSISGSRGFRMTETYFASEDGKRLFVIIRVGEPKPDAPVVGVNRVYDRVEERSPF